MATIKKEISSPRKEVQKKRVEDDDESDDDRSVITLSSDSEIEEGKSKEDEEPMECGTDSSGEEEDEDESDESESDEEDEEETDSDEMTDSDSVWSTVDENGETEMITSEAIEAKIIRKFEKSMILLADKQIEKAKNFLLALLKKPLISIHRKSNIDFEEIEEISRPSKILQVYVAIHKNLAKLEPDKAIEHYLQVLYYTPNDTSIWMEVALKSFENGDLQFALYCFKKCDNLKESTEAHATVLYLTCNYSGCLYLLKDYIEDVGELNDKMKYFKFKIRSTSNYYRKMCDNIFEEDDFYKEVKSLDSRRIAVFDQRFEEMSRKIREKQQLLDVSFNEEKELKPIQVEISEKQNLTDVFTIFCDIFDRIQAYSKLNYHPIEFKYWGNRKDYLEIEECLNEIVDIVDCVEDMTEKIGTKKSNKKSKEKYLSTWKTRLFVEEEVVEICETEDESDENRTESRENSPKNDFGLEENELAIEYGLKCENIRPICMRKHKERSPARTSSDFKNLDDENLLNSLRNYFLSQSQNLTITEIIKISLLKFSNYSGVLKNDLKVVVEEMYTRLAYYQFMATPKYDQINIIMMECDHRKGLELCLKKYISFFGYEQDDEEDDENLINVKNMSENELYLRFCWKYSNTNLLDSIKLEYLYVLKNNMDEHRVISTSIDQFDLNDVKNKIEIIEKKLRIESIKQLWNSKNYQELIRICENDIDFSETGVEETEQILVFWLKSLEKSKKEESFVILATRILHFYLFSESNSIENYEESIDILLKSLRKIDFSKIIDEKIISSLGYFICVAFQKSKNIQENWRNWKLLYEIVKSMRNVPIIDYISTLDKIDDSDCLPSLELNVLVKAHEILGEAKKCCQNENFEFLFFIISRFREIVNNIPLLEKLFEKEYNWIWQNLNDEISQILNCLFGKYSKKRKCADDHGTKGNCKADMKIANKILRVILVQPLPLYDDKERLGHDVVELINSKFEFLLEIKPEKQKIVESFEKILKESSFQEEESIRQEFENIKIVEESEIQALVWYSLALNSYRTSNHEDCKKYSQLYLTSIDSTYDDRLRSSAWAILAHEHVRQLFQLDKNAIFNEWRWRILPFKMAISAQPNEAVIHFEVAATMYQLASQLIRFVRQLPLDDLRRKRIKDGSILREYSRYHFDKCLQLAQPSLDGTPAEFNWLCYFFIGKLAGKQDDDIVKVVEYFYEAACGCQLAGFYYPVKINSKKQTNFEPLEVHYQAHSAVWKYLDRNDNPPLNTLLQLESYLKVFANGHKVVKYSNSLFDTPPELYLTVSELVENVAGSEIEKEEERVCQEILTKLEVIEKLKTMCQNAFLLICERFPHIKSHYRLAEWYLENGKFELASEQILKNVFKRKKRDDGVFDNIIEISCNDINRAGSFCFHVERCLRVAIYITTKMLDVHNLASILISLISTIALDDDQFIEPRSNVKLIRSVLESIETVCLTVRPRSSRNTPSPPPQEISQDSSKNEPAKVIHVTPAMIRNELWRIWNAFLKRDKKSENEKLLAFAEKRISALITKIYGSIQILRTKVLQKESTLNNSAENLPRKTKNVLKRKAQANALDVIQPFLKKTALSSIPSTSTQIAQDDDDIQCLDPPVVTVNQQLAHTWNTIMQQFYSKK